MGAAVFDLAFVGPKKSWPKCPGEVSYFGMFLVYGLFGLNGSARAVGGLICEARFLFFSDSLVCPTGSCIILKR